MRFPHPSPAQLTVAILAMSVVVLASNILVQYAINDWLTWGAITYPFAFLVTELVNRAFGPAQARRVAWVGFAVAVAASVVLAPVRIAAASGLAFLLSQMLDITVFDKLRQSRWWRAPLLATMLAAVLDTCVFWGVGFAGEDRHRSSLLPAGWPGATVAGTIALPHLGRWFPSGWLRTAKEQSVAQDAIDRLGIRTSGPRAPMESLSGGNQQKVVLARWQCEPRQLLLLDEPFQGVDVGARADIVAAIRADQQAATLIATSDMAEALEVADRIFLMEQHGLRPITP